MTTTGVTAAQADAGLWDPDDRIWGGSTITYSIPGAGAVWNYGSTGRGEPTDGNYGTLSATQAGHFRTAVELWDSYIARSLNEVSDATPGQIRVAFTDVTARQGNGVAAYAYTPPTPGGSVLPVNGDVWIDETYKARDFAPRTDAFQLLLHESGHALGLKHPFEQPTLPAAYDSTTYTVMSYSSQDWFYAWSGNAGSFSVRSNPTVVFTPMVLDILAMQGRYGADTATNAGNTTFAFADASLNGRQSIYDAAGTDTLDLSALSRGSKVDLRPGAYSDLAYYAVEDQIDDLCATFGEANRPFITQQMTNPNQPAYEWANNLGLSFSTTIERVIGSSSKDEVIGNAANNTLDGRGGADVLRGQTGNDTYYVENAGDKALESANAGTDQVLASVTYTLSAGQSIETLRTTSASGTGSIGLTGNDLAQSLYGNAGKNVLDGRGGSDTMTGYGGQDAFLFKSGLGAGNLDKITDFSHAQDTIQLSRGVFTKLSAGNLSSVAFKEISAGTVDSNDRILYDKSNGSLYYDSDGSGATAAVKFAVLTTKPADVNHTDFLVVA